MKNTDGPGQETLRFSLPIETLISAFREAEEASLRAGEQLEACRSSGSDGGAAANLQQEILRVEQTLFAALQAICNYQTQSLIEVQKKLTLWLENAEVNSLSPLDRLVRSAHNDIDEILAA